MADSVIQSSINNIIMNRLVKIVCLGFLLLTTTHLTASASGNKATHSTSFDWSPIIEAIIQVESEGNPKAVSGNSCGAMQITPIMVKECNRILRQRGSSKRYTLRDRFSVDKSKEMFLLIQSHSNPSNNVEQAIRAWNGGPRYSTRRTQKYYDKVMRQVKK